MSDDPQILAAITKPGNLTFPSNLPFAKDLTTVGWRAVRQESGHLIFYGPDDRRFLATDPDGNPLHECEWTVTSDGRRTLNQARIKLDWGRWVRLTPGGLVNATSLDLSTKPGWQQLRADDLRRMAAQALRVPIEEVRFFYGDEDLIIDGKGKATIRHKKDAFHVPAQGGAERPRFMACMGAMHWDHIDFLPVVELFQSLLPGTGSAAFELIRGLYDDQNEGRPQPAGLRYRGIPPYPSAGAFKLFSSFFVPHAPGGGNPLPIFMDPSRSQEIVWLPAEDPPKRYFDTGRRLCVTVAGGFVHKTTLADDASGLSYLSPDSGGFAPCNRTVSVTQDRVVLRDGSKDILLPLRSAWGGIRVSKVIPNHSYPVQWQDFFVDGAPAVAAETAYSAVLFYPEDESDIEEAASQPFVADYLQDLVEQDPRLSARLGQATGVLIDNFDAALVSCINLANSGVYSALYYRPEFAQKQAQLLWNQLAQAKRLDWSKRIKLLAGDLHGPLPYEQQYDVIYRWVPFSQFGQAGALDVMAKAVKGALAPGGIAFLAGPEELTRVLPTRGLDVTQAVAVSELPTFHMHRTILPKARLKAGLTFLQTVSS